MRRFPHVASLILSLTFAGTVPALSQVSLSQTEANWTTRPGNSPVSFVYVSAAQESGFQVFAYSVAANGALTAVPGSPFPANANYLAGNGKYLFGTNGVQIDSYAIGSDGALAQVASIDAQSLNDYDCGGPENLFLDRTGATLYDPDFLGNICANNAYQAFSIDQATGALTYLGAALASPAFNTPLSFTGENVYGYSSDCYRDMPGIFAYQRNSDSTLSQVQIAASIPTAPAGMFYCPLLSASDSSNHVAVPLLPINSSTLQQAGPSQIAIYTADASGNLSTSSTYSNMPTTGVGSVNDIRISPSGTFVAVAGNSGLQVFRFNGANQISHFSGLLFGKEVDSLSWDNSGHLYAISTSAGKLAVLTVSSTGITLAPGSPYSIASPQKIAVVTK